MLVRVFVATRLLLSYYGRRLTPDCRDHWKRNGSMLELSKENRVALWKRLVSEMEGYIEGISSAPVSVPPNVGAIRDALIARNFDTPISADEALSFVSEGLWGGQVHTSHRRYYGLFNPRPATMGIAADAMVAAFNPQLAAWSHNPFACEVERYLVAEIGARFGYDRAATYGSFTSGGAEANHTALLAALNFMFPEYATAGARAIPGQPTVYVSEESHHSFVKAAKLCGIGMDSIVTVPLDESYLMDPARLTALIQRDRDGGRIPFMVVATMGTTNGGLIDPIDAILDVARSEHLWVHADAAWGGGAVMIPELRGALGAIYEADSITFDAHKWMSVPMGAGMFFTRHDNLLEQTFAVDTGYMPTSSGDDIIDPHRQTMQWSRRFIGLKVFMSLLVAGWDGYEKAMRQQTTLGNYLREQLPLRGWEVVGDTPLPTVCWVEASGPNTRDSLAGICARIVDDGRAWLSTTLLGGVTPVLRATITNYATEQSDVDALLDDLDWARRDT